MMHRRFLSAGVAAAAAIPLLRPAHAQAPSSPQPQSPTASVSPLAIRDMTLAGGAFSMQSSELARTQAASPALRQFAELEGEEQRAVLQAMQLAGVAMPATIQLPPDKSELLRRQQAASGTDFDRLYLAGQIAGHEELLQLHSASAQGAQTPGERAVSTVAVPGIRTHLAMLQGLQAQMRG